MRLSLHPILRELRALYDIEGVMPRFRAYVDLMTGGPEFLPLGAFSPMGQRQAAFLDALTELDAEGQAARECRRIEAELEGMPGMFRLLLVVLDEPRDGWTQRWLTDAEWRFQQKYDRLPQSSPAVGFDRWVTVQLWTDAAPSPDTVRREVRASVWRAAWQARHGLPVTLRQMLAQEGGAARFAGEEQHLDAGELAYTREVLTPLLGSAHWPTCFAALYGDDAARAVGFPALGLSHRAGFGLALATGGGA
ncbi:hypothetical protein E5F05_15165 [Deinococcus metallilatus]|uniref:Uncharacterized protein n=1 Tax=Deinococcus metallilatus TaxID=1211322 RepID=A0AAJ5JXH6_9DEIO|nr:hypothetical protein [Deinococcus metallilatus]MBB5296752.1 hypothetical protein [Deinococcus metallilatus]QBY09176.1 hypothetical protein E5F05_15165 [Deinococcus metallilatus]RXJ09691.1 hypothetical protein ERJ73_13995 [Deinococcus metallilatus]TLK24157.1 hypothetical protein FCS05_14955 [Deinococcus metallilatus]GMA13783.1 hypothetical protein GCM10025871_01140 [Deinococcus metallilatus]